MAIEVEKAAGSHLYGPETLVSEHTNRPVEDPENPEDRTFMVFWCGICSVRLGTARTAMKHILGKPHNKKVAAQHITSMHGNHDDSLKRKLDAKTGVFDPETKKLKAVTCTDPSLRCEDCNLQFNSTVMAIQHFKGKKHAATVAAKLEAKKSTFTRGGGSAGNGFVQRGNWRGRGGRGRGRGVGFNNPAGGIGRGAAAAAGHLARALKNFYDQTPMDSPGGYTWNPNSNQSNRFNFSSNESGPSSYMNDNFFSSPAPRSQPFSQGQTRGMYNSPLPRMNFFNSRTPSSSTRFGGSGGSSGSGGGGGYYSKDYWRK